MSLLGLDIGTTGTKAVLFTESGRIIDTEYQDYPHVYPHPGWVELEPERVWSAVCKTVSRVAERAAAPIKALGISCLGDNLIPVARDNRPLYNGILAVDDRATAEVAFIDSVIGRRGFFEITGGPLTTTTNMSKVLWLKRNRPDIFAATWKYMMFADYVLMRMGFAPLISYSMASLSIFDLKRRNYPTEMLTEFGVDVRAFSELVPPSYVFGEIPLEGRTALGLPAGIQVVAGGIDLACGVLGAGVSPVTPEMVADVAGTMEHAAYVTSEPAMNEQAFIGNALCFCNVVDDSYLVFKGLPTAGAAMRWFSDQFAGEEKTRAEREGRNVYDVMFEPLVFDGRNVIMHPYLAGHYDDSSVRASIQGITLATTKDNILAGLIEGITHELRNNIELIESVVSRPLRRVRAVGGLARSAKWLQLRADITGRNIETASITEASALGAAIVAGLATGVYSSTEQAVGSIVTVNECYSPRQEFFEIYNRQHEIYNESASSSHY